MKKIVASPFLLSILALAAVLVACSIFSTRKFTSDVRNEASYFRMRVHLRHADAPVEADIVVGCGARITRYRDGGSSLDIGRYPYRYAFAIPGGHALEIRTPGACRGATTANGEVAKDFLPEIVWFERADDLSFGILYASDDAYANPSSRLSFLGAEIETATREDFERWMASAPENLIPRWTAGWMSAPWPEGLKMTADLLGDPARFARLFGPSQACYAGLRLRIPEPLRAAIARFRPADQPRYWVPAEADRNAVNDILYKTKPATDRVFEGHLLQQYGTTDGHPGDGLLRRAGGGTLTHSKYEFQGPLFPLRSESGVPWLKADIGRSGAIYADFEIGPATQGFAYCFDAMLTGGTYTIRTLIGNPTFTPLDYRLAFRINDVEANGSMRAGFDSYFNLFENDEYLIRQRHF